MAMRGEEGITRGPSKVEVQILETLQREKAHNHARKSLLMKRRKNRDKENRKRDNKTSLPRESITTADETICDSVVPNSNLEKVRDKRKSKRVETKKNYDSSESGFAYPQYEKDGWDFADNSISRATEACAHTDDATDFSAPNFDPLESRRKSSKEGTKHHPAMIPPDQSTRQSKEKKTKRKNKHKSKERKGSRDNAQRIAEKSENLIFRLERKSKIIGKGDDNHVSTVMSRGDNNDDAIQSTREIYWETKYHELELEHCALSMCASSLSNIAHEGIGLLREEQEKVIELKKEHQAMQEMVRGVRFDRDCFERQIVLLKRELVVKQQQEDGERMKEERKDKTTEREALLGQAIDAYRISNSLPSSKSDRVPCSRSMSSKPFDHNSRFTRSNYGASATTRRTERDLSAGSCNYADSTVGGSNYGGSNYFGDAEYVDEAETESGCSWWGGGNGRQLSQSGEPPNLRRPSMFRLSEERVSEASELHINSLKKDDNDDRSVTPSDMSNNSTWSSMFQVGTRRTDK